MKEWWLALISYGVLQGLLLAGLIFVKTRRKKQALWSYLLLFCLSLCLFDYWIQLSGVYESLPHATHFALPCLFLLAPLYYFFVTQNWLGERLPFRWGHLLHFLPAVIMIYILLPYYQLDGTTKIMIIKASFAQTTKQVPPLMLGIVVAHFVQISFYYGWLRRILQDKRQEVTTYVDPVLQLRAMIFFNNAFLGYWLLIFLWMLWLSIGNRFFLEVDYIVVLCTSLFVHALLGFHLLHSASLSPAKIQQVKYNGARIQSVELDILYNKIARIMKEQQLFIQEGIKVETIAKEVGQPAYQVSQCINRKRGVRFNDWINEFRIKHAIQLMQSPRQAHYDLLSIAMESGFSNKNTFIRAFKKVTGQTPSKFRESIHL